MALYWNEKMYFVKYFSFFLILVRSFFFALFILASGAILQYLFLYFFYESFICLSNSDAIIVIILKICFPSFTEEGMLNNGFKTNSKYEVYFYSKMADVKYIAYLSKSNKSNVIIFLHGIINKFILNLLFFPKVFVIVKDNKYSRFQLSFSIPKFDMILVSADPSIYVISCYVYRVFFS